MGRILTAAELEERARIARRREQLRAQRTREANRPYRARPPRTTYFVHSVTRPNTILTVSASERSIAAIGGLAAINGLATAPGNSAPLNARTAGIPLATINWYFGDANPEPQRTPWDTRWIRYYDATGGQSHFRVPVGIATTSEGLDDLILLFTSLFNGAQGQTRLGENGRAYLAIGRQSIASMTV